MVEAPVVIVVASLAQLLLGDIVLPRHLVAGLEHRVGDFVDVFQAELFLFGGWRGGIVGLLELLAHQFGGGLVALCGKGDLQVLLVAFLRGGTGGFLFGRGRAGGECGCGGKDKDGV